MKLSRIFFILIFVIFLVSCAPDNADYHNKKENAAQNISGRISGRTLLGIAAFREFEKPSINNTKSIARKISPGVSGLNSIDAEVEERLQLSYGFDYVKIHSATKFDLYIPEDSEGEALEAIKDAAGLGHLEVVVADFTTFIIDPDEKNIDKLIPSVSDTLIVFRGSQGLYTILSNSYALGDAYNYEQNHHYWLFSSHKTITSSEVIKDFTPPIYGIILEMTDDDIYYISFTKDNEITSLWDFYANTHSTPQYGIDASSVEKVSRDTLYSILELNSFPEKECVVQIQAIDIEKKRITVSSDDALVYVFFDENTELNKEPIELSELWSMLFIGDYITVTYDNYFKDYHPTSVYANSVIVAGSEVKNQFTAT